MKSDPSADKAIVPCSANVELSGLLWLVQPISHGISDEMVPFKVPLQLRE